MYHTFESIQDLEVELTNKCNAACPMCARNKSGGITKPDLVIDEWTKNDIDNIFSNKLINLQNIMMCGTHGDPCMAKNLLYAINIIKKRTDATIEIFTNGSTHSISWWSNLGKILNENKPHHTHYRKNDLVIFGIDGLEDTNHLYRRNTNFNKIIENAKAFIDAGGIARWDFIVFKHNEHQIKEAEQLAKEIGFKQFRIRKTSRFDYSPTGFSKWPVKNNNDDIEYYLEPPSSQNKNKESSKWKNIEDKLDYFDKTKINCFYKNEYKRMYVNAYAQIFPCCFLSNDIYPAKNEIYQDTNKKIFNKYGKHLIA